eukprot:UN10751
MNEDFLERRAQEIGGEDMGSSTDDDEDFAPSKAVSRGQAAENLVIWLVKKRKRKT